MNTKKRVIDEAKLKLSEREKHLKHKKSELNTILEETKKEEEITDLLDNRNTISTVESGIM